MILLFVIRLLIPLGTGWLLSQTLGVPLAPALCILLAVLLPATGAVMLRNSEPEKITWRNRVAGWLIPWGYQIGQGRLWAIAAVSALAWGLLLSLGVILGSSSPLTNTSANFEVPSNWTRSWLVLVWIIDGTAFFFLVGKLATSQTFLRPPGSTQLSVAMVAGAVVSASVVLFATGNELMALWISGVPTLLLATLGLLWCGAILVAGKNARWN